MPLVQLQIFDVVINVGGLSTRADIFSQQNPYFGWRNGMKDHRFLYHLEEVERVIVGKEAILSELRNSPLEITLREHYCTPPKTE